MRVVYEAWNLIDASLVRHALEDAGFPAFVRGEALLGGFGGLPTCGLLAVSIPDSCQPQARALLDALPLLAGDGAHAGPIALAGAVPA